MKTNNIIIDEVQKVTEFRVRTGYNEITQVPTIEVQFLIKETQMDMEAGHFDKLILDYYGMLINLRGCIVRKQGSYSGGDMGPQPWKLRCYEIHLDNKAEKECITEMAKDIGKQ